MKALLLPTLFLCFALSIVAFAQDAPKRAPRKTQVAGNRLITIMGTKLDAVLKEFEDHRDEDIAGAEQLRRHDDQLQDHGVRIKKLEAIRNP